MVRVLMTTPTEAARALRSAAKRSEFTCAWCGARFEADRSNAKFCSRKCRDKAWHQSHKDKRQATV